MEIKMMSGLPRSGSTLMRGILEQHHQLKVTPYSGLRETLELIRTNWNSLTPHKAYDRTEALERVLQATIENYHQCNKLPVDYDRGWTSYIRQYEYLTGSKAKIVCLVRPVVEVIASMEKLKIERPLENLNMPLNQDTMDERITAYLNGFVGLAYNSLLDSFQNHLVDRLLIVDYTKLVLNPSEQIQRIVDFWDIDSFTPDLSNIKISVVEDDRQHGLTQLHRIKSTIEKDYTPVEDVLSFRIIDHINKEYPTFWRNLI